MTLEDCLDIFAEGVSYVTREGWVQPSDIEDPGLAAKYQEVVEAFSHYESLCQDFQKALDKAEEEIA